jgi:predicted MFS family arabinose efflux permease
VRGLWRDFRACDPVVRLLCVNQFGINVGFYMLMPYLAAYLTGSLGIAAATAGVILGVRNLCQQGMFFAGGTLADRFGCKPLIVAGCALRTAGFAVLALNTSLPALVVGMAATGLAGALFNPAVRTYLAHRAADRRVDSFAVFNVCYQAGILAGPLIGLALIAVDFRLACAVAAVVFAVLTVMQLHSLPDDRIERRTEREHSTGGIWRAVLTNRAFLVFAVVMAGAAALNFQIYLALPLLLEDRAPEMAGIATMALFAVSGAATALGQSRVTRWCKANLDRRQSLALGLAVTASAFLAPAAALWLAPGPVPVVAAVLIAALLLAMGTMIAFPFEMDAIVDLAGGIGVGTHYGAYSTIGGVEITLGNLAVGGALSSGAPPGLVWLGLAAGGFACAAGLCALPLRTPEAVLQPLAAVAER